MGTEQQQQQQRGEQPDFVEQRQQAEKPDDTEQQQERTEKPEVTEEHKNKAKEMARTYEESPQTTTLPGTGGTVSGTAITDWVDDEDKGKTETTAEEGKVEFRKTEEFRKKQEE
jgi:hypothetical protein